MTSFDLDLVEVKIIDDYTVRICNDDFFDYVEIMKGDKLIKRIWDINPTNENIRKEIDKL